MDYRVDDKQLNASVFLSFVNQIWPGVYDAERTQDALSRTLNITAYDGEKLAGCLRILSDGYYFGTITELLVLPEYRNKGVGSRLLQLAKASTPTMLYFGAQPGVEGFYEKNGCRKGMQAYTIEKKREQSRT
jgi:GNAT superfamily N-acetyltransferase